MVKRFTGKKNSIIFTWLISYTTVLIIPLIISYFVSIQTKSILEEEIIKANQNTLTQVRHAVDQVVERVELMGEEIQVNPRINALLAQKSTNSEEFDIYKARQDLSLYAFSKYFLKQFFLVFYDKDLVITSEISASIEAYLEEYLSKKISMEQWKDLLAQKYHGTFVTIHTADGKKEDVILYLKTIQSVGSSGSRAALVVMLDKSEILGRMQDMQSNENSIAMIVDKSGEIVVSTQTAGQQIKIPFQEMKESAGYLYTDVDGQEMVVSYIASDIEEWSYVLLTPREVFWQKSAHLRQILNLGIAVSILIGLCIIVYLLRKSYSPIGKILKILKDKYKIDQGTQHKEYAFNEYTLIEQAITTSLQENQKKEKIIEKQIEFVRTAFLVKLLKGTVEHYHLVEETLSSYNICFQSEYFSVILFHAIEIEQLFPEEALSSAERKSLMNYIISNIAGELACQNNQAVIVEAEDMMVCLMNYSEQNVCHGRAEMLRIAENAQNFISENFNVRIIAAISNIHETFVGISAAYREAQDAMEYNMLTSDNDIAEYVDIQQRDYRYGYSMEKEQKLINFMKAGDARKAEEALDEIVIHNFENKNLPFSVARCMMFDIISTILKAATEISDTLENRILEESSLMDSLLDCGNIHTMKRLMVRLLGEICAYTKSKSAGSGFVTEVEEFIKENYGNDNLNVNQIGNHFGMAPSYLSMLFKEQKGESLLDYISKQRIEKAKELLRDTSETVEKIAERVGYTNKMTFTRLFKKYEGITPGKYRSISKNDE